MPTTRPKRRLRRLLVLTIALAVSAVGLWLLVWTQVERNWREAWVAAADRVDIDVELAVDRADPSFIGQVRNWLGLPRVQVYLSNDTTASRLLRGPAGEPHAMLIHVEGSLTEETHQQVAARFPGAEIRYRTGGMGGHGVGFF